MSSHHHVLIFRFDLICFSCRCNGLRVDVMAQVFSRYGIRALPVASGLPEAAAQDNEPYPRLCVTPRILVGKTRDSGTLSRVLPRHSPFTAHVE